MNKQPHPTNCIACGLELHGKEVTKADVAFMEKLNQAEKEFESRIIWIIVKSSTALPSYSWSKTVKWCQEDIYITR